MNQFVKGYLIGKSIELTLAGTFLLIAHCKGYLPSKKTTTEPYCKKLHKLSTNI